MLIMERATQFFVYRVRLTTGSIQAISPSTRLPRLIETIISNPLCIFCFFILIQLICFDHYIKYINIKLCSKYLIPQYGPLKKKLTLILIKECDSGKDKT